MNVRRARSNGRIAAANWRSRIRNWRVAAANWRLPALCASALLLASLAVPAAVHGAAQATPAAAQAQEPPPPPPSDDMTVIQSYARLTVLDVTVTDNKGRPVQGLGKDDFEVSEDGKPRPLRAFEEFRADMERPTRQPPPLPPNVYTNLQPPPSSSSVNVLLLDALNTQLTDQAFVKSQTLEYLKSMPAGTRVAIMTLSSHLRLLQGFTQDPAVLEAAIKGRNNRQLPSPLLNDASIDTDDSLADLTDAGTAAVLQQFTNEQESIQREVRNEMTLEALNQIAAYLSTIPGRKNLIWFTSGMPLQVFPTGGTNDLTTMSDYSKDLRKTTDLLTASQIAVYPVDARGLFGDPALSAANGGSGFSTARGGAKMAQQQMDFLNKKGSELLSMEAVAEATGGVAYYNTNGLKQAVEKAIENGANYYQMAYVPPAPKFDGAFHRIHVKLKQGSGYHLAYRTGYYADDVASNSFGTPGGLTPATVTAEPYGSDMDAAMQRGVPLSSRILFDVRVVPVDEAPQAADAKPDNAKPADPKILGSLNPKLAGKPLRRYDVQYIFPGRQIAFTAGAKGTHRGSLDFDVAAYDVDGRALTSLSQTINLPLSDAALAKLQHSPFQFLQQLDLPAGDIFLRIGIHDGVSGNIGTLEIPLSVRTHKATPTH